MKFMGSTAGTAFGLLLILVAGQGCATKGFVQSELANSRAYTDSRISEVDGKVSQVGNRAEAAYDKAALAEQLAAGELEFTEVSAHRVHFAFDDWTLDSEAQSVLDNLASRLSSYPRYVLEIRGYADATGSDRYNYRLGRERAESVQRYMITRYAVPAGRMAMVSFGEENPLSADDAENRRVQVRLLDVKPQGEPVAASD